MSIATVSFIGSGNVATHLAKALYAKKIRIVEVYSPNRVNAEMLALAVGAGTVEQVTDLAPVDLIVISVTDQAIEHVGNSLKIKSLVVHTSGSTPLNVLSRHPNHGVLYPFQTFTKSIDLDFSQVPVFIEANNPKNCNLLKELASLVSEKVYGLDSEQRLKIHLAAVFANNFSNHMLSIAKDLLDSSGVPFDILHHLISETSAKAIASGNPAYVQTGPAVRGNLNILKRHKEILADRPLWQKIYTFVSNSIIERETERKNGTF